ncbi:MULTISPECIES: hypothetical protein [Metallosphaera]|uniref:hypothetical protein n=1 Tax=Bacteria TaxID=2 RepID=UPI002989E689|nr:hypothetical protein [Metallosphaera sedula]MCP6729955.1 hypothetical protein [Metallosphaera sedula]
MTDAISLALSTGLGPVIGIIIIMTMMGLTYKMAGKIPAIIVSILSTLLMMYMDFLPLFWGIAIVFGALAGLFVFGEGVVNGD